MEGLESFSALILAGGQSSRMRKDKYKLQYQGKSFLSLTQDKLAALSPSRVFISGGAIEGGLSDLVEGIGPIAGIHAASKHTSESLLVVPIDMPMLTINNYKALIHAGMTHCRTTLFEGSPLPVFLHRNSHYAQIVENTIDSYSCKKDLSLYSLSQKLEALALDANNINLNNINTPSEYNSLTKR